MDVCKGAYIDPDTFESVGKYKVTIRFPLMQYNDLREWVNANTDNPENRIELDSSRMISRPVFWVYLDTMDQVLLFKLTFGGIE